MKMFRILVEVEPKEEETLEGERPVTPTAQQVADAASDYLSEIRKDAGYGWMVHQVLSAEEF